MRAFALLALMACSAVLVLAAPQACPSLPVQLELRPNTDGRYQLVFASIDPHSQQQMDFVDIHYRVNNEESVNMRVMTEAALTSDNQRAKHAQIDGIELQPGDALRAYATYSAKGYACDTPIHTFSAPEQELVNSMNNFRRAGRADLEVQAARPMMRRPATYPATYPATNPINTQSFWTQAIAEQQGLHEAQGLACPSIQLDQDIVKIQGLADTYLLTFENKNPAKQLHYVDLHLSTSSETGWDNLRLASDMQLNLAHKVMQPGVVVKPNETLKWYWSYRTMDTQGQVIDCTTPISVITPAQITHEITMQQLQLAANN
jgi:hypothetical protein